MNCSNLLISVGAFAATTIFVMIVSITVTVTLTKDSEYFRNELFDQVDPQSLSDNLANLTAKPHVAGSEQDEVVLTNMIKAHFEEHLQEVKVFKHRVRLSYTHADGESDHEKNSVSVFNNEGQITFAATLKEAPKVVDGYESTAGVSDLWLAFTPAGTAEGVPLYVNYGREKDFRALCDGGEKVSPTLCDGNLKFRQNYICIMRYGKIFRGNKVQHAEKYGCKGALLYNDPQEYAKEGMNKNTYADGVYLPSTGGQRGTSLLSDGDPETPGYPADPDGIYFRDLERGAELKARIVAQVVNYGDMQTILGNMNAADNLVSDSAWKGQLDNVNYNTGPGFSPSEARSKKIQIVSHNYEETREINTVCGFQYGSVEPDRYIIYGNHRDAWAYGAIDPNSGTASLMEVVKAYGYIIKEEGYTPKRTLMFCSLAAEEYGLIGSYELVEELQRFLRYRGVAYLNLDQSVSGNTTFTARGSPHMRKAMEEAAKVVDNALEDQVDPNGNKITNLYENWSTMGEDSENPGTPYFPTLGSGSDFRPFLQLTGIASVDFRYRDYVTGYPLYHSMYETHWAVANLLDRGFKCHKAITEVWLEVGRNFADKSFLPFDVRNYGTQLKRDTQKFLADNRKKYTETYGLNMTHLELLVEDFGEVSFQFQDLLDEALDKRIVKENLYYRRINDVLMNWERMFLNDHGLLGREFEDKHLLYAPSQYDSYANAVFPTLDDYDMKDIISPDTTVERAMKNEFALICSTLQEAIYTVKQSLVLF